jgi:alpha-2-macroglobulin
MSMNTTTTGVIHTSTSRESPGVNAVRRGVIVPACLIIAVGIAVCATAIGAVDNGPLQVLAATPRGPTTSPDASRFVVVSFDRPMVPLQMTPVQDGVSLLSLEPAAAGRYRWMGTSTLVFEADEPLPAATRFRARVPLGTESLDGAVLPADHLWEFETPRPASVRFFPEDGQQWVDRGGHVYVQFNQTMDPATAKDGLRLREEITGSAVAFTLRHATADELTEEKRDRHAWRRLPRRPSLGADPGAVLVLTPRDSLQVGTSYELAVMAGVPGAAGPLLATDETSVTFGTIGAFRFQGIDDVSVQLADGSSLGPAGLQQPGRPFRLLFSNPVIPAFVMPALHVEPAIEWPDYQRHIYPTDRLRVRADLIPDTLYTITLADSVTDAFGDRLRGPRRFTFRTGDYPPLFQLASGPLLVDADGAQRVPATIVNVDSVRLQMTLLDEASIVPRASRREADTLAAFDIDRVWLTGARTNRRTHRPIELQEALKGRQTGIVLLRAKPLGATPDRRRRQHSSIVQVTRMGVTLKASPTGAAVWVTSLRDGTPVAGAHVEVRDDSNAVVWQGQTGADGGATGPGWSSGTAADTRRPKLWALVRHGEDLAIAASDWGGGIAPYRFGIPVEWNPTPQTTAGTVFTERGIYRAGEDVFIKGIVRRRTGAEAWHVPKGLRVALEVRDSRGGTVLTDTLSVSDWGAVADTLQLDGEAHLGGYRMSLHEVGGGPRARIASGTFMVEAYRPATFAVGIHASQAEYVFGDSVATRVDGRYLFGAPMKGAAAVWWLRLAEGGYQPPDWENFRFGPLRSLWDRRGVPSQLLLSGEGPLDDEGMTTLTAALTGEGFAGSATLTVEARVTGPSQQAITGREQLAVHRGEFYIGLGLDRGLVAADSVVMCRVAVVAPKGAPVSAQNVLVRVYHRQWHSVQKAGVGGRMEWVVEPQDTVVDSLQVQSGAEPLSLPVRPAVAGFYYIRAEATDARGNQVLTERQFFATGGEYVAWARRDDDRIDLVPDKASYAPGDTARVLVQSPFERATALVTLERETVLETRVIELVGTAQELAIPLTAAHLPNVFLSVALVQRPAAADSQGSADAAAFRIGYTNLPVTAEEKRLRVSVAADHELYRPGDSVSVRIHVTGASRTGAAEVTVSVADAGVMSLIQYQVPDPFGSFYGPRRLSVQTAASRLHLVAQRSYGEKGEPEGGDGMGLESAFGAQEFRSNFQSTAFWVPSVVTDKEGEAEVRFKLPDNLTRWRIQAVAHTQEGEFGRGESTFAVDKPLMLTPALPRFARVGDRFEAGAVVHNQTGAKGKVSVTVAADGIQTKGRRKATVKLEAAGAKDVSFDFRATTPGTAVLRMQAQMKDSEATDGLQVALPVQLPTTKETAAVSGHTDGLLVEQMLVPEDAFRDAGGLAVLAAPTALSGLGESYAYLQDYPFRCLEQQLSQALPAIVAGDLLTAFGIGDPEAAREQAQTILRQLPTFQGRDGGFHYWPGSGEAHPYGTAYAVATLAQAKASGFDVSERTLDRGVSFLRSYLRGQFEQRWQHWPQASVLATEAMAVHALSLAGQPEAAYATRLFERRSELPVFARALLLKAAVREGDRQMRAVLAMELGNLARIEPTKAWFGESDGEQLWACWHTDVRTTAIVLQALLEAEETHPLAERVVRWLLARRRGAHWGNTQENVSALQAMAAYFRRYEKQDPAFTARVRLAGREVLAASFHQRTAAPRDTLFAMADLPAGASLPLEFSKEGAGNLHYSLRLTSYPKRFAEPRDEGIAVFREMWPLEEGKKKPDPYREAPEKLVFAAGSLVRVTVRVVTPIDRSYMAVTDPLPAGLEAVNLRLATEGEESGRQLRALRGATAAPWYGFRHVEMHDDRVLLFADRLPAGVHSYSYLARATTRGTFVLPPVYAEAMYTPEIYGRGRSSSVEVK